MTDNKKSSALSPVVSFSVGSLAGMGATTIVQPFDLIKTRLQTGHIYNGPIDCLRATIKNEGFFSLYTGLSAALLRQVYYSGGRFALFHFLDECYKNYYNEKPTYVARLLMGMAAGAFGSFIGTPTEVALIRMTADGQLPDSEKRNYKNVFDAFRRIIQEEGFLTLFRGAVPTVYRGTIVNMVQLSTYYQTKDFFVEKFNIDPEKPSLHFVCGLICGFLSAVITAPLDFSKTRTQNMKIIDGKPTYNGMLDAMRKEGVMTIYSGFLPYFLRIGPRNVFTFVFFEELAKIYFTYLK